ncbi:MAG: 1-acyl-sn-glycerol-3-phosphate acyltransferase [Syntrophorhabdaceae bacterium PtaU1.Bin034]|jgi:1-acyl-sn-glycerol-3-phosphate acyltransferase|nr:MAG: 1-acyl-sn-glycerol-3-phosphate acyltransferase [Syntrophorhabdaceae bacterium PtaU1.Bin034]
MRKAFSYLNLVFTTLFLAVIALAVSPFDPKGERIHGIARFWARICLKVAGISVSVEGAHRICEPPYLLMSNHQSALDIFVLLAAMPVSFKFIAKRELFLIPFFGWAIKRAGYISIDRENPREALKAIEEAVRRMRDGTTVLIFPEGTRSRDGKLLPFLKGGFSLASRAAVPVAPLAIIGSNPLQPPGCFVPVCKGHVTIQIGKPILLEGKGLSYKAELAEEVRSAIERLLECPKN